MTALALVLSLAAMMLFWVLWAREHERRLDREADFARYVAEADQRFEATRLGRFQSQHPNKCQVARKG